MKEECDVVDRLNDVILKKKTNYRAKMMLENNNKENVSVDFFMRDILGRGEGQGGAQTIGNANEMKLDYKKEDHGEEDYAQ
jgi:hypothetical protein